MVAVMLTNKHDLNKSPHLYHTTVGCKQKQNVLL